MGDKLQKELRIALNSRNRPSLHNGGFVWVGGTLGLATCSQLCGLHYSRLEGFEIPGFFTTPK